MLDDDIMRAEQAHLDETYAKLEAAHAALEQRIAKTRRDAAADIGDMRDELALDKSSDIHTESMAELMSVNSLIDSYSRTATQAEEDLRRNELLLAQPYFAKVSLKFAKTGRERDVYLGSVGATDENQRHFIVDWRSPVAETYYNQANGPTSYVADGRTIDVELTCRRQFDIERDKLNNCFDTTVAIEDPLLLQSLSKDHSEKLQAITATIQKEQNEVVRHEDVPVLLVNGIAGSGKTSVLLQRIAYLFYRMRDELDPSQVYLFTPNPVFSSYIDEVLPNMGEKNPQIFTWDSFARSMGAGDRGTGAASDASKLAALEDGLDRLNLQPRDFRDIRAGEHVIVKAQAATSLVRKYERIPIGPRLISIVADELHERVDRRIAQMARDEAIQEEMLSLDPDDQLRFFGSVLDVSGEEEIIEAAEKYVKRLCSDVHDSIDRGEWLRIDRIGMRMLGADDLSALEWLYLYALITGNTAHAARYVMIDEVQDYSEAQLMLLERWFDNAHFMLLGDEHQAIREGTATFAQVKELFNARRGSCDECRLVTSYRSSPEITKLFCGLLDESERRQTSSVQHAGVKADVAAYPNADVHRNVLRSTVRKAKEKHKLTAIITSDRGILKWVASYLDDEVRILHADEALPAEGAVLLDLSLAKGLEFDCVIIPDATAGTYPDTPLARRRLYTAISRATHKVALLAQGELTPLLSQG